MQQPRDTREVKHLKKRRTRFFFVEFFNKVYVFFFSALPLGDTFPPTLLHYIKMNILPCTILATDFNPKLETISTFLGARAHTRIVDNVDRTTFRS